MKARRSDRRESKLFADVYTRTEVITAGAENMSDDGVCLTLGTEIPKDELVGVSMFPVDDGIEDPDVKPVNLPAKVVWCNKQQGSPILAGLRFVSPPTSKS